MEWLDNKMGVDFFLKITRNDYRKIKLFFLNYIKTPKHAVDHESR